MRNHERDRDTRPAKHFIEQAIVALRRRGDAIAADAKQQQVDTAAPRQLLDQLARLLDCGEIPVDAHLGLLEADCVPDVEVAAADGERVWLKGHGAALDVWRGLRDLPPSNQVDH